MSGLREKRDAFRSRRPAVWGFLVVAIGLIGLISILKIMAVNPLVGIGLLGIGFLAVAWKVPHLAIVGVVVLAATNGGSSVLIAAPLVVMLAGHSLSRSGQERHGLAGWLRTSVVAVVAFLLSFLVANIAFRSGPDRTGGSESSRPDRATSSLIELLRRIFGKGGDPFGTRPGDGIDSYRPSDPPIDWWRIAAIALVVAAVVCIGIYLWRRFRQKGPGNSSNGTSAVWSLERLEQVGAAVGRERKPNEGAIAYGNALAEHTGDDRLREAGIVVSAKVFQGPIEDQVVTATIEDLEAHPPPTPISPVAPSRRVRATAWTERNFASVRDEPRVLLVPMVALGVVGLLGWLVASRSTDLSLAYVDPETSMVELEEPPDEVRQLLRILAESPQDIRRWQTCSSVEFPLLQDLEARNGETSTSGRSGFNAEAMSGLSYSSWSETGIYDQWDLHAADRKYSTTLNDQVTTLTWWDMTRSAGRVEPARAWLTSVDTLLGVMPPVGEISIEIDRTGHEYMRYEFMNDLIDPVKFREVVGWKLMSPTPGGELTLDVWSDGDALSRARTQLRIDDELWWNEFRVNDDRATTLAELYAVDCPSSGLDPSNDWFGIDS